MSKWFWKLWTHHLPDEYIVNHGAAAVDDSSADQRARDDCWRGMKLDESVEDDS